MDPIVTLGSSTVAVGAGREARLSVRIRNPGRRVESYRVEVIGAPASFARADSPSVSVLPTKESAVDLIFAPPSGANTPTGTLPFAVRVVSEDDESESAVAEGTVEMIGVAGTQVWVPDLERSGRWETRYTVQFANQGDAAVRLALVAHDPSGATSISVEPRVIDMGPGGRSTAQVELKARQPFLFGGRVSRVFTVTSQSLPFGAPMPVPGASPPANDPNHRTFRLTFEQRPILSMLAIPLALLIVAGLVVLLLVRSPDKEEIELGVVDPEAPAAVKATPLSSTEMTVEWAEVPNATTYDVWATDRTGAPLADQPLAAEIEALEHKTTITDLAPQSEFCFAVRARAAAGDSELSAPASATTESTPTLDVPRDLTVAPDGTDFITLDWTYAADPSTDLTFAVFVDGESVTEVVGNPAKIALEQFHADLDRTIEVKVRAVQGDQTSPFSDPQTFVVPARSTVTVPPSTQGGPVDSTTTVPSDTGVSTTTIAPVVVEPVDLHDLERTSVAIIRPVVNPPPASEPLDVIVNRLLSALPGLTAEDIKAVSTRDTVVSGFDGPINPNALIIYVELSSDPARDSCDDFPGVADRCDVGIVEGAARRSVGTPIADLDALQRTTSLKELDAHLFGLRQQLDRGSVYVLDGVLHPELSHGTDLVVYAGGFETDDEAREFCSQSSAETCTPTRLGAALAAP